MKKLILFLLFPLWAFGQNVRPSQITPGTNGQTLQTIGGVTAWGAADAITQLTGDVVAGPGSGSQVATVKGLSSVPFCTGFSPTNGQVVTLTTGSSPNPCWTASTPSGNISGSGTSPKLAVFTGTNTIGNIGTPTTCGSGEAAQGIDANGNATGCFTPSGSSFPVSYLCTGTASTDTSDVNTALAAGNVALTLNSATANCSFNNQIILYTGDKLILTGSPVWSLPDSPDGNPNDEAGITNEAAVSPTTHSYTCALTAASNVVNCSTASFTAAADSEQSFSCTDAQTSTVDLHTSIAYVASGTQIQLSDATGSGITAGNFSCTETIRDHDIGVYATGAIISMTSVYPSPPRPREIAFFTANRVTIQGGNWIEPDGSMDWHFLFGDIDNLTINGTFLQSWNLYQDGIDVLGPTRNISFNDNTCNTYDDCIILKNGEYQGTPYDLVRNVHGTISGASISNTYGSGGSRGNAIQQACINASGTCVTDAMTNITINGIYAQPLNTGYGPNTAFGFNTPVTIACSQASASDCGTSSNPPLDQISISNIYGVIPGSSTSQVVIGAGGSANQYIGNVTLANIGPMPNSQVGNPAIHLDGPSGSNYLTISGLAIRDAAYNSSTNPLVGIQNNVQITNNYGCDNPYFINCYSNMTTAIASTANVWYPNPPTALLPNPSAVGGNGQFGYYAGDDVWEGWQDGSWEYFGTYAGSLIGTHDCADFGFTSVGPQLASDSGAPCGVGTVENAPSNNAVPYYYASGQNIIEGVDAFNGIVKWTTASGPGQATSHDIQAPSACADTSGSGTAQTCATTPSFTPAYPDCVNFTTSTTNSGSGLTLNVNSSSAISVAIPSSSGYTTTLTASIIPTGTVMTACLNSAGTAWDVQQTGTQASGSPSFSSISSGTNTSAAMVVGSGASLTTSGDGSINATELGGYSIGGSGSAIPLLSAGNSWGSSQSIPIIESNGTQTISGCSLSSAVGGQSAGSFSSGTTGTCTVTITPGGTYHGMWCEATDITTTTDLLIQTATSTTSCTFSGTTVSGDTIVWHAGAF